MLRPVSLAAFLNLRGEPALVVGGGPVALRRARTLLDAGLRVTVVAPDLHPDFAALPVCAERRAYRPADLEGVRVVVAATDRHDVNDAVTGEARAAGVLVNHAGDAEKGTLRFPAALERGGVRVAVSTGRELPVLAQALRERIESLLPEPGTVDAWAARREEALGLPAAAREGAMDALRADIRAAFGLPGAGRPGGAA
nr:bifunctional precorrin-2 dehydrogenase/sirohydrochlorin ferrochelatase [Deinococcus aestuarii]